MRPGDGGLWVTLPHPVGNEGCCSPEVVYETCTVCPVEYACVDASGRVWVWVGIDQPTKSGVLRAHLGYPGLA